jgi:hypothetical protein
MAVRLYAAKAAYARLMDANERLTRAQLEAFQVLEQDPTVLATLADVGCDARALLHNAGRELSSIDTALDALEELMEAAGA